MKSEKFNPFMSLSLISGTYSEDDQSSADIFRCSSVL